MKAKHAKEVERLQSTIEALEDRIAELEAWFSRVLLLIVAQGNDELAKKMQALIHQVISNLIIHLHLTPSRTEKKRRNSQRSGVHSNG